MTEVLLILLVALVIYTVRDHYKWKRELETLRARRRGER